LYGLTVGNSDKYELFHAPENQGPATLNANVVKFTYSPDGDLRPLCGPAPTGQGAPVMVRFQPTGLNAVDEWRRQQLDLPTRPEAIRRLVEQGLKGKR
jgi:hypothetical protein